jgi:hypothetical protein
MCDAGGDPQKLHSPLDTFDLQDRIEQAHETAARSVLSNRPMMVNSVPEQIAFMFRLQHEEQMKLIRENNEMLKRVLEGKRPVIKSIGDELP